MIAALAQFVAGITDSAIGAAGALTNGDPWAPAQLTMAKLWHSAWPILAGAALAGLIARWRRPHDEAIHHTPEDSPNISLAAKLLGTLHPILNRWEQRLRSPALSGALLVAIIGALWLLLR